jgi:hypothetical protein
LNTPDWIGKRGPREYTHIHIGVHKDMMDLKKGEVEMSRPPSADSPMKIWLFI